MKRSSFAAGILAAISPLLLIAALVLPNARDARVAWKTSSYSDGVERPLVFVQAFHAAVSGRLEARRDIRAGRLALKMWGLRMAGGVYETVLEHRYGIQCRTVAGCIVAPQQMAGWNAYNDEMRSEIARRYGDDALDKTWDEARLLANRR
jgi:hypothetical protein